MFELVISLVTAHNDASNCKGQPREKKYILFWTSASKATSVAPCGPTHHDQTKKKKAVSTKYIEIHITYTYAGNKNQCGEE